MKLKVTKINSGELRRLRPLLFNSAGGLYYRLELDGQGRYKAINLITQKEATFNGTDIITSVHLDHIGD